MRGHIIRGRSARFLRLGGLLLICGGLLAVTRPAAPPTARPAETPPQPLAVSVTGNPPGEEVIRRAVAWEVLCRQNQPGSACQVVRMSLSRARGDDTLLAGTVTVRVTAPGGARREETLPLRVTRLPLPSTPEGQLFVSNRPHEKVFEPRTLFEGRVTAENPARILYHHLNASPGRMTFAVELLNPSARAVRVQMLDALRGPLTDVIRLGHLAAMSFVEQENRGAGYVITVPPRTACAPLRLDFPPQHVVSGLGRFRVLTPGGDIILRVRALGVADGFLTAPLERHTPSAVYGAYQYSVAPFTYRGIHIAGRERLSLPLGEIPAVSDDPARSLKGGYGVWHTYQVMLVNPLDKPAAVTLHVSARGGPARLIYSLGREWRETRMLRAFQEMPLARYQLAPREVRAVTLTTVPQAGSAYPLRFEWRSEK